MFVEKRNCTKLREKIMSKRERERERETDRERDRDRERETPLHSS